MNREEFLEYLRKNNIEFIIQDDKIVFNGDVWLNSLTSIPDNCNLEFNNSGNVWLNSLTFIQGNCNLEFNNGGNIWLDSLASIQDSCNLEFNNGGRVGLNSLASVPKNCKLNNGGFVLLKNEKQEITKPYIERHNIKVEDGYITLYKRVSADYETQEYTKNETLWKIGSTLECPNWNPGEHECGPGKFHACAKPHWCDGFRRDTMGDKYIAIKVHVDNIYEWKSGCQYPQKIAFRKGEVIAEVNRMLN